MALRIDLLVPSFVGTGTCVPYTVYGSSTLHDLIADQLPVLEENVEQNLAEFDTGDITLAARNDDGWWDSTAFTSTTMDPNARFPLCLYCNVYLSPSASPSAFKLIFQGDVDLKTIAFDRKQKTVTFNCLGPLHRLEQWSAEVVRRSTPSFCDAGVATATGASGSNWYLRDTTKQWYQDPGNPVTNVTGCCLIDNNGTVWTILGLYGVGAGPWRNAVLLSNSPICAPPHWGATPTKPPPVLSYMIRPLCMVSRYDWRSITGTLSHTATSLTDSGKSWTTNQWASYYLFDTDNVVWAITSNTATALTVTGQAGYPNGPAIVPNGYPNAQGMYSIRKGNYPNLLESLGPPIATLSLVGQTAAATGDTLNLTSANGLGLNTMPGPFYINVGAVTQADEIMFAGPYALGPTLTAQQVWLVDALTQEISERDGITLATPWYRDKTVPQLATLLFAACSGDRGNAVPSFYVNAQAFTNNVVPYGDFSGKSVSDALVELASISNCTLFATFSGDTSTPLATINFQRRDAGLGSVIDLSGVSGDGVTPIITERKDGGSSEWWYPQVIVQGANKVQAQQGSPRPGGSSLTVQSDFISTYAWCAQVLARLWAFFNGRRATATVSVKAEMLPLATAGTAGITEDFEAYTVGSPPPAGAWPAWGSPGNYIVAQPGGGIGGNSTKLLEQNFPANSAGSLQWLTPGNVQDFNLKFQVWCSSASDSTVFVFNFRVAFVGGKWSGFVFEALAGPTYVGVLLYWAPDIMDSGTWVQLAADWANTMPAGSWIDVRIIASGDTIAIKYWYDTSPESEYINLTATGVTVQAGTFIIAMRSFTTPIPWYFDNFVISGAPGSLGTDLFSRVSLSGADEWWVTKITRQLRQPSDMVELGLLSAASTTYTPSDTRLQDLTTDPEPPQVTGVTTSGSDRVVALSWPFPLGAILGFQMTVWSVANARPKQPTQFEVIGNGLTVVAGTPPTFTDLVKLWFLGAGSWYIDYQAVLIDGRTSVPSSAYRFTY